MQEFKDKSITVHLNKKGLDKGNGNNGFKFMLAISGAVAEMERELAVKRIREAWPTKQSAFKQEVLNNVRSG